NVRRTARVRASQLVGRGNKYVRVGDIRRPVERIADARVRGVAQAAFDLGPGNGGRSLREPAVIVQEREVLVGGFLFQEGKDTGERAIEQVVATVRARQVFVERGRQCIIRVLVAVHGQGHLVQVIGARDAVGR